MVSKRSSEEDSRQVVSVLHSKTLALLCECKLHTLESKLGWWVGSQKSVRAAAGVGCRRKKMKMRSSLIAPVAVAFDRKITADVYHKVAASVGEPRAAQDSDAGRLRNHLRLRLANVDNVWTA